MINSNMSMLQYVCAQQINACAQSLKLVSARTHAQLRGNTGRDIHSRISNPLEPVPKLNRFQIMESE